MQICPTVARQGSPLPLLHLALSPLLPISLHLLTPSLCLELSDSCLAQPCPCPDPHCIRQKHLLSLAPCCVVSATQGALSQEENLRPGSYCPAQAPALPFPILLLNTAALSPLPAHNLSSSLNHFILLDLGANFSLSWVSLLVSP